MSKIITVIIILILIALGMYYFAPDSFKFWQNQTAAPIEAILPTAPQHERITAKHQFKNGSHVVAGEVNVPTPCHILTTSAHIAESFPEQVTIAFVSQSNAEFCAQVITTARFKVDFNASENATIKATWNGSPVELNLIPAGANEDLSNFELFIKG
jgi:hypothetical protein